MARELVSIVVPTWNGLKTLPDLVARVRAQQVDADVELVALDSASTDGTAQFLETAADVLVPVAPGTFDHGRTRNEGVARSRGEYVVLLVQDALPATPTWLAELLAPLRRDARVAGTFARQLPLPTASPLTRDALSGWVASSPTPRRVSFARPEDLLALSPAAQLEAAAFDDVCACLRREAWRQHPLPQAVIAEDARWAREVLLAGWALEYAPAAAVFHSHDRGARYEFLRTAVLHHELRAHFGLRAVPSLARLALAVAANLPRHLRRGLEEEGPWARRGPELARSLALAAAWPAGQYVGGLFAERRWPLPRVRGV